MPLPSSPMERAAPWVAGALLAAPVLIARYPPMGDLAFHEALIGVLRSFSDTSLFPAGLYVHSFGAPNQLFHAIGWALSLALPTDLACKLIVAASVLSIPVTAARLADHLGASRWTSLIVAPVALGWMFRWGLVTNLLGLPLLLGALPALDRLAQAPSVRRAAMAVGFSALLYLGHESSMMIYVLATALLLAGHPLLRPRETLLRLSPAFAAAALVTLHTLRSVHPKTAAVRAIPDAFVPIWPKIREIPGALFGAQSVSSLLFVCSVVGVAFFVAPRLRGPSRHTDRSPRALLGRFRFELLGLLCFVLYLILPLAFQGATLIYHRFLTPAWAILIVASAPRSGEMRAPRVGRLVACALPVATVLASLPAFAESSRTHRALDALFPLIHKGSAIAQLDFSAHRPSAIAPVAGAVARVLATRGGRLLFSFSESDIAPALIAPKYDWSEPIMRTVYSPLAFCPSHDLRRFRYVIAKVGDENMARALPVAFSPEAKLVDASGEWLLFESTLDLVPLTSPDVPLPDARPFCLDRRLDTLFGRVPR